MYENVSFGSHLVNLISFNRITQDWHPHSLDSDMFWYDLTTNEKLMHLWHSHLNPILRHESCDSILQGFISLLSYVTTLMFHLTFSKCISVWGIQINYFSFCFSSSCYIRKTMEVIFWMDMIKCFYSILLYIIFLTD